MKRAVIAMLIALAFVCCSAMAVLTAQDMSRAWGASAVCSIGSMTSQDLSMLTALYPDLGWTAYVQSLPEQVASESIQTRTATAAVLRFMGAPNRIAFFPVISGRLPLDGERGACALDRDTASLLFGSVDPGEVSVRLDGEPVRVVGVMDAPRPLMLMPARDHSSHASDADDGNPHLATFDRLAADDRDTLLTLSGALGIEPDPFELSGAEMTRFAWLLCAVPWLLGTILVLISLRNRGRWLRTLSTVLLWTLALGALLVLLWSIPVRLLPARWSDLAFYGEQMTAWKARPFRVPDVRDELLKSHMLRMGLWCGAACVAMWMERMWLKCGKSR